MQKRPVKVSLRFGKGDFAAIVLVVLLGISVFLLALPPQQEAAAVEIYQDGILLRTELLSKDAAYTVSGAYENTIQVQNGRVCISHSSCPGGDCMHSGWISVPGRSIVCLPNRVEVRVVGAVDDIDLIVG